MGDPVARVLQRSNLGPVEDPVAKVLQGSSQVQSDPVARLLGQIPPSSTDSLSQPAPIQEAPTNSLRDLPRRYVETVKQIASDPVEAVKGMAKSVFFDALKATITPIKPLLPPEFVKEVYPSIAHDVTPKEYGGALLRTALNIGVPAAKTFGGAAVLGAGSGALSTPDDPLLGAALGGTIGPAVHGGVVGGKALARQVGSRAGSKKIAATGAPAANTKNPAPEPPPPATPEPKPVRDLSNFDVLKMTPQGIDMLAQQAAREEAALYTTLFGTKGARKYRSAVRKSTAAGESPETAAKALATLEAMKSQLSTEQQIALDEINARGFTSKRLKNIAGIVKDYSPEILAKIDDESLTRQFGEVLMTKNPDRNLSGLYRLQALYKELLERGATDDALISSTFSYMLEQGVKAEGLAKLVTGKMVDVRKTLEKIAPEVVAPQVAGTPVVPDTPTSTNVRNISPEAAKLMEKVKAGGGLTPEEAAVLTREAERIKGVGVTKRSLEPISEAQFEQELAAITPKDETITLYHGSPNKFSAFDEARATETGLGGKGFFFGATPDYAKAYGENIVSTKVPRNKLLDLTGVRVPPHMTGGEAQNWIRSQGYEGVFNPGTGEYIIFDPNKFSEDAAGAARVAAARTTPFPDIDQPISSLRDKLKQFAKDESGQLNIDKILDLVTSARQKDKAALKDLFGVNAGTYEKAWRIARNVSSSVMEADKASQTMRELEARLNPEQLKRLDDVGVHYGFDIQDLEVVARTRQALSDLLKDESGFLNLDAFTDPLQIKVNTASLPTHSKNIQNQIEVGYTPPKDNPLRPIEGFYAALVRRIAPLEKNVRQVEKANNIKVAARDNPAVAVQLLAGWAGKAQHFLQFGGFREVGGQIVPTGNKGLEQILNGVGDYNAFRRLAIAERVAELDAQGRKVETGISTADAVQEIANATPGAKQAIAETHQYLDGVLQFAEDGGLLDQQTTAVLRQLGRAYVPLDRVLTKGAKNTGNIQYSALSTPQQFRALIGSKLKIVDPIFSITDYTRRIVRAAELNKVGQTLIDYVAAHPNETKGWLTREKNVSANNAPNIVATGQGIQQIAKQLGINIDLNTAKQLGAVLGDSNLLVEGDVMRVRVGGEVHQYRVDPTIGKILRSLQPQNVELWMRLASIPSQALRTGITANPVFGAFQAFVGAFQSKIQSRYGFRITQDPFIGLYNRVTKSDYYKEALAAGGTSAFLSATSRSTEAAVRSITDKGLARVGQAVAHPFEILRMVAEPLEEMNRLGEYVRARKAGADVYEAALAMREVDTDFSMIGTQMAGLSHLIAFANPAIQGVNKFGRTAVRQPETLLPAAIMGVTAPSVLFWLAGQGDEEVRRLQRSQQGLRYWMVRVPGGEIMRIPKPYVYGEVFGNTAEAVLDQLERDVPEQYELMAKGLTDSFSFLFMPTALQLYAGIQANRDPLNNWSPIVPESREGLEPELQYGEQTSETAKRIGEVAGISPAKIDFAIRNLGGTLAQTAVEAGDKLFDKGPASPPTPVSADLPLIGRFFARYPSQAVEPIRTFYKNAGETAMKLQTAKKYGEMMLPEKLTKYVEDNQLNIGLAEEYAKTRLKFTEYRKFLDQVRAMPDEAMSPKTKRELTDQTLNMMIEEADIFNNAVRSIRKGAKQTQ